METIQNHGNHCAWMCTRSSNWVTSEGLGEVVSNIKYCQPKASMSDGWWNSIAIILCTVFCVHLDSLFVVSIVESIDPGWDDTWRNASAMHTVLCQILQSGIGWKESDEKYAYSTGDSFHLRSYHNTTHRCTSKPSWTSLCRKCNHNDCAVWVNG